MKHIKLLEKYPCMGILRLPQWTRSSYIYVHIYGYKHIYIYIVSGFEHFRFSINLWDVIMSHWRTYHWFHTMNPWTTWTIYDLDLSGCRTSLGNTGVKNTMALGICILAIMMVDAMEKAIGLICFSIHCLLPVWFHFVGFNYVRCSGWWFGTWLGYFSIHIGNFIIPTDDSSIIFERGRSTTNQDAINE